VAGGVGVGLDEAPTLPQPEITRMAAAATVATGILKWCKKMKIAVAFSVTLFLVTHREMELPGRIDEWLLSSNESAGGTATCSRFVWRITLSGEAMFALLIRKMQQLWPEMHIGKVLGRDLSCHD
jgi:hypothetical protein